MEQLAFLKVRTVADFGQDVSECARLQIFDSLKFPKVSHVQLQGWLFVCVGAHNVG